jgi:4-coumarate--CoA ligase
MPVQSAFPPFELPKQDIWAFLFERKDKPYPDDKGLPDPPPYSVCKTED